MGIQKPFDHYVADLHAQKHAAYGDSWKRRGEMLGILANVARKVDRLGVTDDNETAADTAIDLLVYLVKYRLWLVKNTGAPKPRMPRGLSHVQKVAAVITDLPHDKTTDEQRLNRRLFEAFDHLEELVKEDYPQRWEFVEHMIIDANCLARTLYWRQGNAKRSWTPEPGSDPVIPATERFTIGRQIADAVSQVQQQAQRITTPKLGGDYK